MKSKNKYIKWLWISLIGQLIYATVAYGLLKYVDDNFRWMFVVMVPGVLFNWWLDRKADKEQERASGMESTENADKPE